LPPAENVKLVYLTNVWRKCICLTDFSFLIFCTKRKQQKRSTKISIAICVAQSASHTTKIVARILRRTIEKKVEDILGENQFGFRRGGKNASDAVGMLKIMSQRTLGLDEELCACFIDWKKAFDRVKRTKLTL
jgi:hypothetical protein